MTTSCSSGSRAIRLVTAREAFQTKQGALVLDVRTPSEFEGAHIPGSVPHPLSGLNPGQVEQLAAGKYLCLLVCAGGTRARQAAERLSG